MQIKECEYWSLLKNYVIVFDVAISGSIEVQGVG